MAKLYFKSDVDISANSKIGISTNDIERDYLIGSASALHTVRVFEITDLEYEGLINGTKHLSYENNSYTINNTSPISNEVDNTKDMMESAINVCLQRIDTLIEQKPNHSKINSLNELKTFVESIDVDSLTYPHVNLDKHLLNNNKYIDLSLI